MLKNNTIHTTFLVKVMKFKKYDTYRDFKLALIK